MAERSASGTVGSGANARGGASYGSKSSAL